MPEPAGSTTSQGPAAISTEVALISAGDVRLDTVISVLRREWWRIVTVAAVAGMIALVVTLTQPTYFRAQAVVAPTGDDTKQVGPLSALATIGLQLGGPSKIEDLEALLRSQDLTARVFAAHDIWGEVLGDRYDAKAKIRKVSILERLFLGRHDGPPTDWDAIRAAGEVLKVVINKKAGTLTLSFESATAEGVAKIVDYYLQEAKSRLQEEAIDRAQKNKAFLEQQARRIDDALAKDRLFTLLSQEIEREMMARNREQFGFKLIDSPRVPDRKAGPHRLLIALAVSIVVAIIAAYAVSFRALARKRSVGA